MSMSLFRSCQSDCDLTFPKVKCSTLQLQNSICRNGIAVCGKIDDGEEMGWDCGLRMRVTWPTFPSVDLLVGSFSSVRRKGL
jgi:hypothetical protein